MICIYMQIKQEPMQNLRWVLNVSIDVVGQYENRCEIYITIVKKESFFDH